MRMALIQGMKNANKTAVRFQRYVNGGFLEAAGQRGRFLFKADLCS
jgi:hypothetical protein